MQKLTNIIISGVPRVGKTTLATTFSKEKNVFYLSQSCNHVALKRLSSSYDVHGGNLNYAKACEMSSSFLFNQIEWYSKFNFEYIAEGYYIRPSDVANFEFKNKPNVLFLGYADVDLDYGYNQIRKTEKETDWTVKLNESQLRSEIEKFAKTSLKIREECAQYRMKYIDLGNDWDKKREEVLKYLLNLK